MFGKKIATPKKVLVRVIVEGNNHQDHTFKEIIQVPRGFGYTVEIGHDKLFDQFGNTVKTFCWRAGYTVTRTYEYEIE